MPAIVVIVTIQVAISDEFMSNKAAMVVYRAAAAAVPGLLLH